MRDQVCSLGEGLRALGVKKGEAVALFSSTRVEWTLCDLAILSIGAVTVPIYQSNTAEQASYLIEDSKARAVFVENGELLNKVRQLKRDFILLSGTASDCQTFASLIGRKSDQEGWRRRAGQILPTDVASYVYTSGTTGPPKGAILTHQNFLAEVEALAQVFDITDRDEGLIFLPLAHIVARALQFFQLKIGFVQSYAESIDKLVDNLGEIRPHFFVGVPRIFEKVHERVISQVESGSPLKKGIFAWASAVGREVSQRLQQGEKVPPLLQIKRSIANRLVFQKLHRRLGGRLRYAVSGGAPLSKEIAEFFHAAGILILEGYGLTETTAAIHCNSPRCYKFGTVGPAVQGAEVKIAPDGEILAHGPLVFQGYFNKPEATHEAFTPDGWFKTGDVGEIDPEGCLRITDRKKDIIVTAGGKNVAPQNIENMLKTVPYISQVMVLGDRKKYLSALVTLNRELIEKYARETGIPFHHYKELTKNPQIYQLVKQAIEEKNKKLASFESIKKFAILENDLTQEGGELTPTLKVKRKFVTEKYKDILAQLYQE